MAVAARSGDTSIPIRASGPLATVEASPASSAHSSGVSIDPSGSCVQIDRYSRANIAGSFVSSDWRNSGLTPPPVPSGRAGSP